MKMLRLTEEQLAEIKSRSKVRTHVIKDDETRPKYGNRKTVVDGRSFDSKREGVRWAELKLMQTAGEITELERQVRFPLRVNGEEICCYIADFTYRQKKAAGLIVEDSKGMRTREYIIKKKLMRALHGIEILET